MLPGKLSARFLDPMNELCTVKPAQALGETLCFVVFFFFFLTGTLLCPSALAGVTQGRFLRGEVA